MCSRSLNQTYSLFIDTHDDYLRIMLYQKGKLINKIIQQNMQSHSSLTMPAVDKLFASANITVADLKEIFVVNGPGSFTGVRIAVTIAKTFAFILAIPIKTVTSLEVKAVSSKLNEEKLVVESDKNGHYIGLFNDQNKLIGEYEYLKNKEYEKFISNFTKPIINDENIDFTQLYEHFKNVEENKPHAVKPLYIKNININ